MHLINGVVINKLSSFSDDRGWLTEIFRTDVNNFSPEMSYVSFTKYGVSRGPHEHKYQSDFFVFIGPGDFELYLWDNRKDSPTFGEFEKIVVGETNKVNVLVPPGVVHGYKSITPSGSLSINLPDKLFAGKDKKEEVDEIRHEKDPNSKFKI
jgi:dTDP-4-dehydrorhamnose 3,5-epimerase